METKKGSVMEREGSGELWERPVLSSHEFSFIHFHSGGLANSKPGAGGPGAINAPPIFSSLNIDFLEM